MATKRPPANPVTQEGRDCFALCVQRWQDQLNLNDWRIEASPKEAARSNMAEVSRMDLKARLAVYRIGADFGTTPVTALTIEEIACHEVLHVFLHELLESARDPAAAQETIDSLEHRIIHSLVRLLVPVGEPTFIKKA